MFSKGLAKTSSRPCKGLLKTFELQGTLKPFFNEFVAIGSIVQEEEEEVEEEGEEAWGSPSLIPFVPLARPLDSFTLILMLEYIILLPRCAHRAEMSHG